jgi:copper(I)-binding protein
MFLGLNQPLADGDIVSLTLTFETAGDVVVEVPVDLTRKPDHGKMKHKMGTDG